MTSVCAHVLQNIDAQMAVEQEVLPGLAAVARYDWRLNNADFTDRGGDLGVFRSFLDGIGDELERLDVGDRDAQLGFLKSHLHR